MLTLCTFPSLIVTIKQLTVTSCQVRCTCQYMHNYRYLVTASYLHRRRVPKEMEVLERQRHKRRGKADREKRSGSEGGSQKKWKFLNALGFLERFVKERPTSSYMAQAPNQPDSSHRSTCCLYGGSAVKHRHYTPTQKKLTLSQ